MLLKKESLKRVLCSLTALIFLGMAGCGVRDSNEPPGKAAFTLEQQDDDFNMNNNEENKITDDDGSDISTSGSEEISFSGSTWNSSDTYTGGNEVMHEGKIYKAKWWTQGETPDASKSDGPWEYIGEAVISATKVTEPEPDIDDGKPDAPAKASSGDFKIVGYYPSWEPDKIGSIQYENLTHINYAFAIPQSDGTLRALENGDAAQKIIKSAHKKGVKVLIAIGGWSYNEIPLEPTFVSATDSDAKIEKFAGEIMSMVDKYGFDGVDMDWEHPRRDGNTSKQYEKLMLNLSNQLHAKNKILTSAVLAGVTPDGNVLYDASAHTDAVINAADWFNVMAYDGGDGERHSSYDFAVNSASYWKNTRKMPAEKVVLGVPFYGRPSWAAYSEILAANPEAYNTDISTINGMQAYYNGIPTIQKKTQWACDNAGGIMIWEISQDSSDQKTSLLNAIYTKAKENKKIN